MEVVKYIDDHSDQNIRNICNLAKALLRENSKP